MKTIIFLTGTHLTPALALMEEFQHQSFTLVYLGRQSSLETPLIKQHQAVFYAVPAPKFNRFFNLKAIGDVVKLPLGILVSLFLFLKYRPKLLISFGGFVALPVCWAAKLTGTPVIIHEQTLQSGLTSRLTAPLAKSIAVSWPQSVTCFDAKKTVLTGNPIRKFLINLKRYPSSSKNILYITGGHQGSRTINKTVNKIMASLLKQFVIYHQFGLNQLQSEWEDQQNFKQKLPLPLRRRYHLSSWFKDEQLKTILSGVNLVISRSGINTVTELAYLDIPAILIPLPFSQKDEQLKNAQLLQSLGLALIVAQKDLSPQLLLKNINKALKTLPEKPSAFFDKQLIANSAHNLYGLALKYLHGQKKPQD